MRLYTMYYLCKSKVDILNSSMSKQFNNTTTYKVNNWSELSEALDVLYAVPSLQEQIDKIYKLVPITFRYQQVIEYDTNRSNIFNSELKSLALSVKTIINLYETLGYEESENNLEIKLPDNLNLNELSELAKDLYKVFTQSPFIERESGNAKIIRSDVGSIWLILLGSTAFLSSVGYIVSVTTKAKADMVLIKQSEALLSEMNLKTETMAEVKKAHNDQKEIIMSQYINELSEKTGKKIDDPEERSKAEMTLELLDKWIDKGLQIYAAIDTPREIQVLFPEQPELKLLNKDSLKFLEDKAENKQ